MKPFRWTFIFLVTALVAEPACAQTVNLHCSSPDLRFDYFVDINYAANTVTYRMDALDTSGRTYQAKITDSIINWRDNGGMWHTLSRITAKLDSCDRDGCVQRTCRAPQRQF